MKYNIYYSEILPDIKIIEPPIFRDERGEIYTSYDESFLSLLPEGMRFVHDKFTASKKNVLRGLHGDNKTWKLISCPFGMIYEVVVDWRESSPTFKKWAAFILSDTKRKHILIPPGFLNGYYCFTDCIYHYKLAYEWNYTDAKEQITVKWDSLGISWPCEDPILSERDRL